MAIKIKHRNPQSTDFSKNDIVLNIKEGALFFKSELGVHRLVSEVQTPTVQTPHTTDYGPHPVIDLTPYALATHTHPVTPTTPSTNYFYSSFHNDWANHTTEKIITWNTYLESTKLNYKTNFLMPFSGTFHKIYWRQTGMCANNTIRIYQNNFDENSTPANLTQSSTVNPTIIGGGNGVTYGGMNELDVNLPFAAEDTFAISFQAATDGIHEMYGQILYSQDITI